MNHTCVSDFKGKEMVRKKRNRKKAIDNKTLGSSPAHRIKPENLFPLKKTDISSKKRLQVIL